MSLAISSPSNSTPTASSISSIISTKSNESNPKDVKGSVSVNLETSTLEDKILICGHVPTLYAYRFEYGRSKECCDIFYGNGVIAIDAATYDTKKVNVLVLDY